MTTTTLRLFYSWQSDTPPECSQRFIRQALKEVAAELEAGELHLVLDEATRDEPGSPDIPATIFKKIADADIFLADLSTIGKVGERALQNPNVLLELGFAACRLGWGRIILVANASLGAFPGDLPFDVDRRRAMKFQAAAPTGERKKDKAYYDSVRPALRDGLATAVRAVALAKPERPVVAVDDPTARAHARDLITLRRILGGLSFRVLRDHIESAPHRIYPFVLVFLDAFERTYSTPSLQIFDKDVRRELDLLRTAWRTSTRFSEHYHDSPNGTLVWSNPGDLPLTGQAKKDWVTAEAAVAELNTIVTRLNELLTERFPELDLHEEGRKAWAEYVAFDAKADADIAEVAKSVQEERRRGRRKRKKKVGKK